MLASNLYLSSTNSGSGLPRFGRVHTPPRPAAVLTHAGRVFHHQEPGSLSCLPVLRGDGRRSVFLPLHSLISGFLPYQNMSNLSINIATVAGHTTNYKQPLWTGVYRAYHRLSGRGRSSLWRSLVRALPRPTIMPLGGLILSSSTRTWDHNVPSSVPQLTRLHTSLLFEIYH